MFIGAWVPRELDQMIDEAVQLLDLDRSKFLRAALEAKLKSKRKQ